MSRHEIPDAKSVKFDRGVTHACDNVQEAIEDTQIDIDAHELATSMIHGVGGNVVGDTDVQTLTNKTLTTPIIASLTNAQHNHSNAAGGGSLGTAVVTDAMRANRTALSVWGRSANSTGVGADIAAGTDGHALVRNGSAVEFNTLKAGAFAANTIPISGLVNATDTDRFLARDTAGAGAWEEVTAANARVMVNAPIAVGGSWYGGVTAIGTSDTTLALGVEVLNVGVTFSDASDYIEPGAHAGLMIGYAVTAQTTAAGTASISVWIEQDPNSGVWAELAGSRMYDHAHSNATADIKYASLSCQLGVIPAAGYKYRLRAVRTTTAVSTLAAGVRLWLLPLGLT